MCRKCRISLLTLVLGVLLGALVVPAYAQRKERGNSEGRSGKFDQQGGPEGIAQTPGDTATPAVDERRKDKDKHGNNREGKPSRNREGAEQRGKPDKPDQDIEESPEAKGSPAGEFRGGRGHREEDYLQRSPRVSPVPDEPKMETHEERGRGRRPVVIPERNGEESRRQESRFEKPPVDERIRGERPSVKNNRPDSPVILPSEVVPDEEDRVKPGRVRQGEKSERPGKERGRKPIAVEEQERTPQEFEPGRATATEREKGSDDENRIRVRGERPTMRKGANPMEVPALSPAPQKEIETIDRRKDERTRVVPTENIQREEQRDRRVYRPMTVNRAVTASPEIREMNKPPTIVRDKRDGRVINVRNWSEGNGKIAWRRSDDGDRSGDRDRDGDHDRDRDRDRDRYDHDGRNHDGHRGWDHRDRDYWRHWDHRRDRHHYDTTIQLITINNYYSTPYTYFPTYYYEEPPAPFTVYRSRCYYDLGIVTRQSVYYAPALPTYGYRYAYREAYTQPVSYRVYTCSPYVYRQYYVYPWYSTFYYNTYSSWDRAVAYAPGFASGFYFATEGNDYLYRFSFGYGGGIRWGQSPFVYSWYPCGGYQRIDVDETDTQGYDEYVAPDTYYNDYEVE